MSKVNSENTYKEEFFEILKEVEDTYYTSSEKNTLRTFIESYEPAKDFDCIKFKGNGKNGSELIDESQPFRDKIAVFICLYSDINLPAIILRDMIQEIGKQSIASWGAPEYLFVLSEKMLEMSNAKYIETFGETLFASMDTYGSCISMDYSNIDVPKILEELNSKKEKNKMILDLIEYFEARNSA